MQRSARSVLPKLLGVIVVVTLCLLLLLSHTDWRASSKPQGFVSQYSSDESRKLQIPVKKPTVYLNDFPDFLKWTTSSAAVPTSTTTTTTTKKPPTVVNRYNVATANRISIAKEELPATQPSRHLPSWASALLNRSRASLGELKSEDQMPSIPMTPSRQTRYPVWWHRGWSRSATSRLQEQFVGERPLFPFCTARPRQRPDHRPVPLLEPRPYDPNLKNPCWYKDPQLHLDLRCLPYFYIIGVAKSGASDLYRRIRMHPEVLKGTMREYHWWDRGRFGDIYTENLPLSAEPSHGMKPIALKDYAYLITGKAGIDAVLMDVNATGMSRKIFGDNSPSYLNDVKYWPVLDGNQGCREPRVVIGQHIRHVTPSAKILVIVRHPTPRLYLRFLSRVPEKMSLKKTASFAFHRLAKKSVDMYRQCFEQWSIRHCAYNVSLYSKDKLKLWEGMYPVFLADWLRVFPRQQIHFIRYRDLVRDTNNVMSQIFNFLDLPPINQTTRLLMAAEKWAGRREEHELRRYFGPMVPETVDLLNEFYDPFVDKFAEQLNDEKFLWRDVDHL